MNSNKLSNSGHYTKKEVDEAKLALWAVQDPQVDWNECRCNGFMTGYMRAMKKYKEKK